MTDYYLIGLGDKTTCGANVLDGDDRVMALCVSGITRAAPGQIPVYATHVDATSRAANYMKMGGYIGIGIGGVSSLLAVQEVCSGDSGAACERVKFTEGGKFGGATMVGAAAGGVGKLAGMPICLALGASTGIGGLVCVAAIVGTGTWVGTKLGEAAGEYVGEKVYEFTQP